MPALATPARLSRLKWLDSTVGSEDTVTKPFVPITSNGDTISILGRDVELGSSGLPIKIVSHFSGSNTHLVPKGRDVLAGAVTFKVDLAKGPVQWKSEPTARAITQTACNWTNPQQFRIYRLRCDRPDGIRRHARARSPA